MKTDFFASIIDYPRRTLDQKIWDVSVSPPIMREDIKNEIMKTLIDGLKSHGYRFEEVIDSVHLTGSIGTTQYVPGTDIDVHLIPAVDLSEDVSEDISGIVRKELSGWTAGDSDHVVNYFLNPEKLQELRGDVLYILLTDDWIIRPEDVPMEYDPYETYPESWSKARNIMDKFTLGIEELRRDIYDIDLLEEYVGALNEEERKAIERKIETKLHEIEEDLDIISEDFTEVHEGRKESYAEEQLSLQTYEEEWRKSLSWAPRNVQWKFLERYGWIVLLANLRYIEEKDLSLEEQTEETKRLLEEFNLMFERKEKGGENV